MTAFTARRRAAEFDALVEDPSTGRSDARYAEFLAIVEGLRAVPAPEARPEFVGDLRERLMVAAATDLVPSAEEEARLTPPPRRPRRERGVHDAVPQGERRRTRLGTMPPMASPRCRARRWTS